MLFRALPALVIAAFTLTETIGASTRSTSEKRRIKVFHQPDSTPENRISRQPRYRDGEHVWVSLLCNERDERSEVSRE